MALDPIVLNLGSGGDSIGSDNVGGVNYEIVKAAFGAVGTVTLVEAAAPLPVTWYSCVKCRGGGDRSCYCG
jgi:hypothetical protein